MSERTPGNEVHGEDAAPEKRRPGTYVDLLAICKCRNERDFDPTPCLVAGGCVMDTPEFRSGQSARLDVAGLNCDCDWQREGDGHREECAVFGSYRASESGLGEDA